MPGTAQWTTVTAMRKRRLGAMHAGRQLGLPAAETVETPFFTARNVAVAVLPELPLVLFRTAVLEANGIVQTYLAGPASVSTRRSLRCSRKERPLSAFVTLMV